MQQECSADTMRPPHFYEPRPCHLSLNYPWPLRPHRLEWGEHIQGSEQGLSWYLLYESIHLIGGPRSSWKLLALVCLQWSDVTPTQVLETDKDQSSWNSDWAPKEKRGHACRLAGEEWAALEKNDSPSLPHLCHSHSSVSPGGSSLLSPRDSLTSVVAVQMFTVHPLQMGSSWKPGDGHSPPSTGEALLGMVALLLHLEETALQRQDGSAPGWIPTCMQEMWVTRWNDSPPPPISFWMRRLQERNFEISSPFSKSFH